MKIFLLRMILIIVGGIFFIIAFRILKTSNAHLAAEREVYSRLIMELKGAGTSDYPIVEFTTIGKETLGIPEVTSEQHARFIASIFSRLDPETEVDFTRLNKRRYMLKNFLSPTQQVIFVNPPEDQQIFNRWISFSRIGLNPTHTQALILIGNCSGEGCFDLKKSKYSVGEYFFLEKVNGTWVVQDKRTAWIGEAQ